MAKFKRRNKVETIEENEEQENIIKIMDNWRLSIVPFNVVLQKLETQIKKDTKEKVKFWNTKGYFSKVEAALQHLVELEIQTCSDLPRIIAHIETLKNSLSKITKAEL